MTCNAWNHPSDCTCGWGGKYHGQGELPSAPRSHWQIASSYTIPNARCPVCRAQVFFYASPYGGKVYFDDLGPPWPKHPCTDQGTGGMPARSRAGNAAGAGWKPLLCLGFEADRRCAEVTRLRIQTGRDEVSEFYAVVRTVKLIAGAPLLCRQSGKPGVLDVSTLIVTAEAFEELRFEAFASIDALPRELAHAVKGLHVVKGARPPVGSEGVGRLVPTVAIPLPVNFPPNALPRGSKVRTQAKPQEQAPRPKRPRGQPPDAGKGERQPQPSPEKSAPDRTAPAGHIDPGSAYAISQLQYRTDGPKADGKLLRLQHKLRLKALKKK